MTYYFSSEKDKDTNFFTVSARFPTKVPEEKILKLLEPYASALIAQGIEMSIAQRHGQTTELQFFKPRQVLYEYDGNDLKADIYRICGNIETHLDRLT